MSSFTKSVCFMLFALSVVQGRVLQGTSSGKPSSPSKVNFVTPVIKKGTSTFHNASVSGKDDPYGQGPIYYWGGPTMPGTLSVYVIFYGTFSTFGKGLLQDYLRHVGGSTWWQLAQQYGVGTVHLGGYAHLPVTSTLLTTGDIQNIVTSTIDAQAGSWQNVGNGGGSAADVYFVITDKTVDQSDNGAGNGFCSVYCGWHGHMAYNNKDIKYAWVGSPVRCPGVVGYSSCSELNPDSSDSPNGEFEIDGIVNVFSHELAETASDPMLNAWYNQYGWENADMCNWDWGTYYVGTATNPNGFWNERIGTHRYLIQENWNLATQTCSN